MKKIYKILSVLVIFFASFSLTLAAINIVPNGGTGVGTVTGIIQGNGTSPFSAITVGTGLTFSGGTLSNTGGTVTSVTGTTNRITSTGGTTPAIDISAAYIGQSSITTIGTLVSGAVPASLVTAGTFGTGAYTFPSTLTTTTSETVPLVIGGTAVGSSLSIQSTSGVGTTDFIKLLVGSNGATEAMRVLHNGSVSIGATSSSSTLNVIGVNSSTNTRVLNILGGTGIAGTTTGQDISIFSGDGKQYDTGSTTVGQGGGLREQAGAGGGFNDPTAGPGTYTAGLGGSLIYAGGAGGSILDDPFSSSVTLKGGLGGGLLYVSGAGGDANIGNSQSNSTGGNAGNIQFTTGFGADSSSKNITIGGNSGPMTFSSNRGGNSTGRAAFTSSKGGNSGSYSVTIGAGGTSTMGGTANAAATMTGGNSGAISITQGNAGVATGTAVFGTAPLTNVGGTANNMTVTLGNGGNATGGTGTNTGGNGAGLTITTGKGGTGATANGTDGDTTFKDGYGNTVMTIKGNNTGTVGIGVSSPTAVLHLKAGTATASTAPLKFTSGTSLTTPEAGALEYDGNKLWITNASLARESLVGALFTQTADKSVTNTVTETSIIGTGVGYGLTLPTNFWVAGKTVRLTVSGVYSTVAVTGDTVTIKVKYGSTVIGSISTTSLLAGATNLYFWAEALVTCRSTGATGTVQISGGITYNISTVGGLAEDPMNNGAATTTIDTTASALLDVTVTHSAANASNTVKSLVSSFQVLN